MININTIILSANVFIRLKNIRKIYFEDLIKLNNIIKEECIKNNIIYNCDINYKEFHLLEYGYNTFFNFYEDYDGYIIRITDSIDISNLYNYFNQDKFISNELNKILDNINLEEIFLKNERINQG